MGRRPRDYASGGGARTGTAPVGGLETFGNGRKEFRAGALLYQLADGLGAIPSSGGGRRQNRRGRRRIVAKSERRTQTKRRGGGCGHVGALYPHPGKGGARCRRRA